MISSCLIRPYHWVLAIACALAVHSLLLINISPNSIVVEESNIHKAVVLSLKKMTALPPVQVNTPSPIVPKKIEPIRPQSKPIKKPAKKPKLVKKKTESIIRSPKVSAPMQTTSASEIATAKVVESPVLQDADRENLDSVPAGVSGEVSDDIRLKYLTRLSIWLAKHKRYPKLAKRRKQEGVVKVEFWIDEQGRLLSHQILEHSSYESLNKEVERMLKRASPMPPVPADLRTGENKYIYTIPVHFKLNIVN